MLTIKRPTPTTVLYTVSTHAPTSTLAAHARVILVVLARIIAGIAVAVTLSLEYRNASEISLGQIPTGQIQAWLEEAILTSPSGQFATLIASNINWIWRLLICAGVAWLIFRKGYREESLLVIRGLGVQTSSSSPSYLWTSSTRFIPTNAIQDIFIHEAFIGFEVRFYLNIVVEGDDEVVVVFPVRVNRLLQLRVSLTHQTRAYCRDEMSWRPYGAELVPVSTSPKPNVHWSYARHGMSHNMTATRMARLHR